MEIPDFDHLTSLSDLREIAGLPCNWFGPVRRLHLRCFHHAHLPDPAHVGVRAYGLPPSYDPLTAKILVPPYSCESNDWPGLYKTVGYLSHELGHHEAGVPNIDAPITKAQYVERNCVWEAKAVVNNAVVSDQIRVASEGFVEVPLISENSAKLWSMWSGGESLVDIGKVFCDNNHVASGKTYTKQHEDYYDANYPW